MECGLRRLRETHELGATLSIVDYPFWAPLARELNNNVVLYDCMDDYNSFRNAGRPARELEAEIARQADLVVCSSAHLQQRTGRESALIRSGVDPAHFEAPPRALALEPNGGTAEYWGEIGDWTDVELLAFAAQSLPEVRFVLLGEPRVDISPLAALPNVTLAGRVPYERQNHTFQVRGYTRCHFQAMKTMINADGNVYLCAQKRTDPNGVIGNVHRSSLREIWEGAQRRQTIEDLCLADCPYCVHDQQNKMLEFLRHFRAPHRRFY
jgi:radical SAM protein with 4Fe4S-binding SPASM domain